MPRRIPGPVSHDFPERNIVRNAADDGYTELECPNEDRIAEIERRLQFLESESENTDPDWRLEEQILNLRDEVTALATREPDVSRETIKEDQGLFLLKRCKQLEERIAELEARPVVSDETLRQLNDALHAKLKTLIDQKVDGSLGDLRARVITIEKSSNSVTTHSDPDSAKISRLAAMLQSFGEYLREIESTLEQRQTDLEQRYAEMAQHITDSNVRVMKVASKLKGVMVALESDDEGKAA